MDTAKGITERRPRLVREKVDLVLRQGAKSWRGRTTGLNESGFGARLTACEDGSGELPSQNDDIDASFLARSLDSPPIRARILRIEGSWVPGYAGFVAARFVDMPWSDARLIREFVTWKEGDYSEESKPQRIWFIQRGEEQYGPLTTQEVGDAIRGGEFLATDLVWLALRSDWAPLSAIREFTSFFGVPEMPRPQGDSAVAARERPAPASVPVERRKGGTMAAFAAAFVLLIAAIAWNEFRQHAASSEAANPSAVAPSAGMEAPAAIPPAPLLTGQNPPTGGGSGAPEEKVLAERDLVSTKPSWVLGTVVTLFNSRTRINALGGNFGTWASQDDHPVGKCADSFDIRGGKDLSPAWRVAYDITNKGSFSGTWMRLAAFDASAFGFLVMDIKGEGGFSPDILVELKADGGKVIDRFAIKGITNDWRRIKVPLNAFDKIPDRSRLHEFALVFDDVVCDQNLKGEYIIDNIAFE